MYSSSERVVKAEEVCGVRPVEVREAAAWPVVCRDFGAWEMGNGALGVLTEGGDVEAGWIRALELAVFDEAEELVG